jgi:integrase
MLKPTKTTSKPPRKRTPKPKIKTDIHKLYDGDVTLFRTPNSGDVYQFQMWIHKEQKYIRRSTRSRNLETSIVTAKEMYLDIHTKLRMEEPIFSKTFLDVCNEFLEHKLKEVGVNKTHGRWVTIKSQIKHVLRFVGEDTKVTDVSCSKWNEYFNFRKQNNPTVVNTTLSNEKNTILGLYRFMVTRRYLPPTYIPELPHISRVSRKREHFTLEDWRKIYRFFNTNKWSKHDNPKVVEQRRFIKEFVIVLINTGLRFGELRKVKWGDVTVENVTDKKDNDDSVSVRINLEGHQTKNGKPRVVIGRRGDVFTRLKRFSNHTKNNDFVFVDNDTGEQLGKDVYYKHWNYLVDEIGLREHRQDNTFYCFRHTYCTWRLYGGTDVFTLSKNMGTSVKFIEDHYGQIKMELKGKELINDVNFKDSDRLLFD